MKNGIIIYQSKYGATKKYVDWLTERTNYDMIETSKARINELINYDCVILCGGIYASGIAGLSFLKKNIHQLQHKKIAIFCVGASPYDQKAFEEIKKHNLKGSLEGLPIFYGRGAWNENQMTFKDRTLCKLLHKAITQKDPSAYEPWMKALMSAAGQTCDWTEQMYLEPLLEYIKE